MADLMSEHQVVREGAVARLTVIGGRAVERLTDLIERRRPHRRAASLPCGLWKASPISEASTRASRD